MKFRYRFGIIELIVTIIGISLYYLLSMLQNHYSMAGSGIIGVYICMPIILVIILSGIFGPILGAVVGAVGQLLASISGPLDENGAELVTVIAVGLIIGFFAEHMKVLKGEFNAFEAIDFAVINAFVSLLIFVFIRPMFNFLLGGKSLSESVLTGIYITKGNMIFIIILGLPVLWLVSLFMKKMMVSIVLRGYRR